MIKSDPSDALVFGIGGVALGVFISFRIFSFPDNLGTAMRAAGDNAQMIRALGVWASTSAT